jgi:hypothetical protein
VCLRCEEDRQTAAGGEDRQARPVERDPCCSMRESGVESGLDGRYESGRGTCGGGLVGSCSRGMFVVCWGTPSASWVGERA